MTARERGVRIALAAAGCAFLVLFARAWWSHGGLGDDPGPIFWRYAAPAGLGCLALALAVLPRVLQVNALLLLVLLLLIEGGLRLRVQRGDGTSTDMEPAYTEVDPDLGYRPIAGLHSHVVKREGSRVIYDVSYSFDALHRRDTPVARDEGRDRFAAVFGCSFGFGEGLNDDETLASQLGSLAVRYRPYNYAFSGYGPHHTLALLSQPDFARGLRERDGVAVYVFIDGHVGRAAGDLYSFSYARNSPFFAVNGGGELERRGGLLADRPLRALGFSALKKLQTVSSLGFDIPPSGSDATLRLTAQILAEARRRLAAQVGHDAFYVLLYPGSLLAPRLVPLLREAGVQVLDYSTLGEQDPQADQRIEGDGHPAAGAIRAVATRVVADLRLAGPLP